MSERALVLGRCAGREPSGRLCRRATDPAWVLCEHHQYLLLQASNAGDARAAEDFAGEIAYLRWSIRVIATFGEERLLARALDAIARTITARQRLGATAGGLDALLAAVAADITRPTDIAKQEES
jgi:hypothetical protein